MSALFVSSFAVFAASLLGSGHCVAMCGPILATFSTQSRSRLVLYHFGRLVSYIGLGASAGWLGETLFPYQTLGNLAAFTLALFFLWSAYCFWRGKREFSLFPSAVTRFVEKALAQSMSETGGESKKLFLIGLFTALLPCGWLHTFVVAAVTTGSAQRGALVLFAFWLGTIPALTLGVSLLRAVLGPLGRRYPGLVSLCLVVAAMATVVTRVVPRAGHSPGTHSACHLKPSNEAVHESTKKEDR